MESSGVHFGGQFFHGKLIRIKFAHHIKGEPDPRQFNVDLFIARLINNRMATLHELQTVYTLQDAYYLSEVLDIKEEQIYLQNKKDSK